VRATDAAGNVNASPATRTFTVAEPPPVDPGGNDAAVPISSAPGSGPQPAAPPTPAAMLGVPVLHAPRGPVRIRRGTARLRFDCAEPAGCGAAAFVLRRRRGSGIAGFSATIRVPAGARGSRMVRVRFGPAARRVLRRLRRRPFWVTVVRTGAGATSTRLRLRNGR